jgi:hypothetical protein
LKTEIFENYFEAYEKFKTEILHNKSVALSEETAPQLFLVVLDCTAAGLVCDAYIETLKTNTEL